ncbi:MAG TPA: hypothetical protein VGG72_07725, partial [Bryobacteraceae bacterium]
MLAAINLGPQLDAQASFIGQQTSATVYPIGNGESNVLHAIAMNDAGTIAVADPFNRDVFRALPDGSVRYLLPNGGPQYVWSAVTIDKAGNIYAYAADTLWKVAPDNTVTTRDLGFYTLFQTACQDIGASDVATCVNQAFGEGMAIDPSGNIYFSNDLIAGVMEIPANGGAPFVMDTSPFEVVPTSLATDQHGNLYIDDAMNAGRIVVIEPDGAAFGIAPPGLRLGGFPGSGIFSGITIGQMVDMGVDKEGRIYVGCGARGQADNELYRINTDYQTYTALPQKSGGVLAIGGPDAQDDMVWIDNYSGNTVDVYSVGQVKFPAQAVGTTSSPITVQFALSSGTPVNDIALYSQGFNPNAVGSNLAEFATSAAVSCNTANPVICSAPVTFTPAGPGARSGYIIAYNIVGSINSGVPSRLARIPVSGVGTGANQVYDSPSIVPIPLQISTSVIGTPTQSVTDGAGYTYAVVPAANEVIAVSPSGAKSVVSTGSYTLKNPSGLALDGAGDLFIADTGNNRILMVETVTEIELNTEFVLDSTTLLVSSPGITLNGPTRLATDAIGNLYVANTGNDEIDEISFVGNYLSVSQGNGTVLASGVSSPEGVAVDGAGDVYFTDGFNVDERSASTGAITPVLTSPTVGAPGGLAVDAGGTLYVADFYNGIVELHTDGSVSNTGFNVYGAQGVSLSAQGLITVAGPGAGAGSTGTVLLQIPRAAPSLTFANTTVGNTSGDSPQTITVVNGGNVAMDFTALSYPTDFPESSSATDACTSAVVLAAGNSCGLPISFVPQSAGNLNESVSYTWNPTTS